MMMKYSVMTASAASSATLESINVLARGNDCP
jgi:hypothetical protein